MVIVYRGLGTVPLVVLIFAFIGAVQVENPRFAGLAILLAFWAAAGSAVAVAKLSNWGNDHLFFVPMYPLAIILAVGGPIVMALGLVTEPAKPADEQRVTAASGSVTRETRRLSPAVEANLSPAAYVPSPAAARPELVTATEPPMPRIERVYADNRTKMYYPENCAGRPENAYRMAKSLARSQGYTLAPGCKE